MGTLFMPDNEFGYATAGFFSGDHKVGSFSAPAVTRRNNIPAGTVVHLYARTKCVPQMKIATTVADELGQWVVYGVRPDALYTAVIFDEQRQLNAGILDNIVPVPFDFDPDAPPPPGGLILWTPAQIGAELAAWYDASVENTLIYDTSTGELSEWRNRVPGSTRHMVVANATYIPVNEKPHVTIGALGRAVQFGVGGNPTILKTNPLFTSWSGMNRITVCMLAEDAAPANAGDSHVVFSMEGSVANEPRMQLIWKQNDDSEFVVYRSTSPEYQEIVASGVLPDPRSGIVWCGEKGSPTHRQFVDGDQVGATGTESIAFTTNWDFFLGGCRAAPTSGSPEEFFTGKIYEVVFVIGDPDDDMRQKIEGYLHHKYNIQSRLDASHPYRLSPPYL